MSGFFGGAGGASLRASQSTFPAAASTGALIANLIDPYGSGSTFTTVGTVPGQLALSGATIVKGASAAVVDTAYSVKVRAASADGLHAVEETLTFTARPSVPAAPTISLAAGDGQITITWTDGSDGGAAITAHPLYRGTASGAEVLIGTIMSGSPYVDTGLTNGTAYYYRLSAVNSAGESALSTEQSATPAADPYILNINYTAGSYRYKGTDYASEAALLTAIGGTSGGGIKRLIGPYTSPTSPELTPNGDVHDGTTNWLAGQVSGGPASIAAVSGELQMTAAVSASRPVGAYPFPVQEGKAYTASAKIRKDAAASTNAKFSLSNDITNALGPVAGSALLGNTTLTAVPARNFAPMAGKSLMYATIYGNSGSFTGMLAIDDLTVKECRPYNGWLDGGISGIIEGTTPSAAGAADKVIWQADDNALDGSTAQERNYIRLCYDSTGRLRLKVFCQTALGSTGTQQANIDLGAVATSTAFKVQFLVTKGIAYVSLNDGASLSAAPTYMPGLAVMRIAHGQVATTNDFDGTVTRVRLFAALTPPADKTLDKISLDGDSYASTFKNVLGTATGAAIASVAVGGSTIAQELGYWQDRPPEAGTVRVFWDGQPNGSATAAEWLAVFDQIVTLVGGYAKLITIPPIKVASNSAIWTLIDDIYAGLVSRYVAAGYAANLINGQGILANHGDGGTADNNAIAAGYAAPSLVEPYPDLVHLTAAALGFIANDTGGVAPRWNAIK